MQLGVRHSPQFPLCQKCFKTVFKSPDESHTALILDLKEWDERVLDCKIHFSSLPACMWCFKGHLLFLSYFPQRVLQTCTCDASNFLKASCANVCGCFLTFISLAFLLHHSVCSRSFPLLFEPLCIPSIIHSASHISLPYYTHLLSSAISSL